MARYTGEPRTEDPVIRVPRRGDPGLQPWGGAPPCPLSQHVV